ncbi:hypothetical protein PC122_g15679 [Phytophthora cactorum]|nr:hypothetical protein PC122_g15679 [Phytophthora cactorum]
MQQEITPTFTENELLELLALLDDAIWTRGNECVGPLVREQVTAFTTLQRSLEKIPALNQNDVFPAVNERATDPRECKELYQDLSRNLSKLYSTGVDTMRNRWPSPSLDGNKKLRENQKECLEILPGTSGRENFELTIQIQQRCAGWTTSWTPCKWDVHQGASSSPQRETQPTRLSSEDAQFSTQVFEDFMESLGSDDDVGVLRASDGSLSENTSSASSPPPMDLNSKRKGGATASATMPVPSNVKPKRKRRKHELDHLRAVAAELEKKLNVLNRDEGQPDANHFWKHISNQLMTERQRTVGENARLRQLVREQVKSVKAIQRTLDKTPDLSKMGIAPECSALNGMTQCQSRTSKDLYRELFKNISSSYSSGVGNLLLQQPCMPAPSLVGKRKMNMEMETDGECGPQMCLQFVESRLIPCSLLRIGDHAWDFLSGSNSHEDFQMALQNQGNLWAISRFEDIMNRIS